MDLSIVTTLYYSQNYLQEFYKRITKTAQKITGNYEIIFVNDGSLDRSLDIALDLQRQDNKIIILDLSRNFGHHRAMMTGLRYTRGEKVFLIDCDLEEEPELLEIFYHELKKRPTYDVVYGIQRKRKGSIFERLTGKIFYKLINFLSNEQMPKNNSLARLMSKRYVKSLIKFVEQELYIAGLWYITGYKQFSIPINKYSKGKSTYTLRKKVALFVNAITSFSNKPLVFSFYAGLFISLFSITYIIYRIAAWYLFAKPISGWTSLIISVWFIGGLIIFFLGIIGIYLSKIFIETKNRPYTIIRDIYKVDKSKENI